MRYSCFDNIFISIFINLRRSCDCLLILVVWVCVFSARVFVCARACVCQIIASFSSLWTAVTLCTSTHCQYKYRVHRKEQHASWTNTIPLKMSHLLPFSFAKRGINVTDVFTFGKSITIILLDRNHFNYPRHVATVLCTKLERKVVHTLLSVSDCLGQLAIATERTSNYIHLN